MLLFDCCDELVSLIILYMWLFMMFFWDVCMMGWCKVCVCNGVVCVWFFE